MRNNDGQSNHCNYTGIVLGCVLVNHSDWPCPSIKDIFLKQEIHCSWHLADELVVNVEYTPPTRHYCILFSERVFNRLIVRISKKKKEKTGRWFESIGNLFYSIT